MIKQATESIDVILNKLKDSEKVVDVGGASAPFRRADYIIDYVPYESINWNQLKGDGDKPRFSKETYVEFDICSRKPFPFADKFFDYSICSHVLEDIRDPLWVCSELMRISKAGYIEIPSRHYETTFGIEEKNLAGASHHRWIIELKDKTLQFTFKFMYVHTKYINHNRSKAERNSPEMFLRMEWNDTFDYKENWLNSGREEFEFFLERPITEKEMWAFHRKADSRIFPLNWLSYLKNTNPYFQALFQWFKKMKK